MKTSAFKTILDSNNRSTICDLLALETGLSKGRIKTAMIQGAVWIRKKGGKRRRIRRATFIPRIGDQLELHYDESLTTINPPQARLIMDRRNYSVWYKPAGLLTCGTSYGDHCSLERQAEIAFSCKRPVFPVHRIDREADGLVMLAHNRKAAATLSKMFRKNGIEKRYRIEVLGNLTSRRRPGVIDIPLDGKKAVTEYSPVEYRPDSNTTIVDVVLKTGRLHQIRKHFNDIGFPVMGDPRYGRRNKNSSGMKLTARALEFVCPFAGQRIHIDLTGLQSPSLQPKAPVSGSHRCSDV